MKHPVLVRVFAVVLTIVYLTMLGAGIMGLQNAENDYNKNVSSVNKMRSDLDEYIKLLAENEGKAPYESVNEELTELKEKHEDVAAEHRTELATYSATRGGIKTGVAALDQADDAVVGARYKLEETKKELENALKQLKELQTACTTYNTLKPQLQALQGAELVMANLAALSTEISGSGGSSSGTDGEGGGDDQTGGGDDQTGGGDDQTGGGDETGGGDDQTGGGDDQTGGGDDQTGGGDDQTGGGDDQTGGGDDQTGGGDDQTGGGDDQTGGGDDQTGGGDDQTGGGDDQTGDNSALATAYSAAITAGESAIYVLEGLGEMAPAELKAALAGAVTALKTADPLSEEVYKANVPVLKSVGAQLSPVLSASISQIKPVVDQLEPIVTNENVPSAEDLAKNIKDLEAGLKEIAKGYDSLDEAEAELYYQRTMIWYEMGKLEDQAVELETTRNELLDEEQEIIAKEQLSEEQKERERQLKRLYLTFVEKPEVEEAVDKGEDFVTAVEAHIAEFNEQIHEENTYRGYACILMIVAALPCLIGFLASFEIIKKLGFVRSAALMMLICAVAALGLLNYAGMGISYSAAAVMIFAVMQILVSGRKKRIKT